MARSLTEKREPWHHPLRCLAQAIVSAIMADVDGEPQQGQPARQQRAGCPALTEAEHEAGQGVASKDAETD